MESDDSRALLSVWVVFASAHRSIERQQQQQQAGMDVASSGLRHAVDSLPQSHLAIRVM